MELFQTPSEARQLLLSMIREQAASVNVGFTDLERRLLSSTETDDSVSEAEWEQVNDDPDFEDALADKTATLIKQLRRNIGKTDGRPAAKEFKRCLDLVATEDTYLGGVLVLSDLAKSSLVTDWRQVVIYAVIGAIAFVSGLVYLIANGPYNVPAVNRFAQFIDQHDGWLVSPSGWFQRYSGYVFFAALSTYLIYLWPRVIRDYIRNRK